MSNRQSVTDYKFRQFKNYKVFTTRQWCENKETITTVIREQNGKWQFLTEEIDLEDVRAIPLVELVDNDPTLNVLYNLKREHRATRNSLADNWQIVDERRKPLYQRLTSRLGTGNYNFHGAFHVCFALFLLVAFFPRSFSYNMLDPLSCHYRPTPFENGLSIFMSLACLINAYYIVLQKKLIVEGYKILLFILLSALILYIQGFFSEALRYILWFNNY